MSSFETNPMFGLLKSLKTIISKMFDYFTDQLKPVKEEYN